MWHWLGVTVFVVVFFGVVLGVAVAYGLRTNKATRSGSSGRSPKRRMTSSTRTDGARTVEGGDFVSQSLANAVGTLLAIGVVYLLGVIAGAFTARPFLVTINLLGIAAYVFVLGMFARTGWASWAIPDRWNRRDDDD